MSVTSKYAFILDAIRTQLKKDATFDVRNVFNVETATSTNKTAIYTNIISDEARPSQSESVVSYYGARQCRVGIYAIQQIPVDSNDGGLDAIAHGQVVERIEKRLDVLSGSLPLQSTTDAGYSITIHDIAQDRVTGFVADGSQVMAVLYEVIVTYVQS